MKPLLYFAHCPQTEAIEALDWIELTHKAGRDSHQTVARIVLRTLNDEVMWGAANSDYTVTTLRRMKITTIELWMSNEAVRKMIEAFDGMPIEYCRGCIDYFNQF